MKNKEFPASSIEAAARAYSKRGFYVVPIPSGTNHPDLNEWQKIRLTLDELKPSFADAAGIGILLNPSGLADVDLDCPEAMAVRRCCCLETAMDHGRVSSPSQPSLLPPDPASAEQIIH